jgi:hypothetical protein
MYGISRSTDKVCALIHPSAAQAEADPELAVETGLRADLPPKLRDQLLHEASDTVSEFAGAYKGPGAIRRPHSGNGATVRALLREMPEDLS